MIIKEFKKEFPDTFLPVKIGKYHYSFTVSPIPVKKYKKFYYPVMALNIEGKLNAQAIDYISLEPLLQSKAKGEIELDKVRNRLKKKVLKLQKGGK